MHWFGVTRPNIQTVCLRPQASPLILVGVYLFDVSLLFKNKNNIGQAAASKLDAYLRVDLRYCTIMQVGHLVLVFVLTLLLLVGEGLFYKVGTRSLFLK